MGFLTLLCKAGSVPFLILLVFRYGTQYTDKEVTWTLTHFCRVSIETALSHKEVCILKRISLQLTSTLHFWFLSNLVLLVSIAISITSILNTVNANYRSVISCYCEFPLYCTHSFVEGWNGCRRNSTHHGGNRSAWFQLCYGGISTRGQSRSSCRT